VNDTDRRILDRKLGVLERRVRELEQTPEQIILADDPPRMSVFLYPDEIKRLYQGYLQGDVSSRMASWQHNYPVNGTTKEVATVLCFDSPLPTGKYNIPLIISYHNSINMYGRNNTLGTNMLRVAIIAYELDSHANLSWASLPPVTYASSIVNYADIYGLEDDLEYYIFVGGSGTNILLNVVESDTVAIAIRARCFDGNTNIPTTAEAWVFADVANTFLAPLALLDTTTVTHIP